MDSLSFYMLTWNVVALQPPPLKDLYKLLQLNADFIAIGLQEVKSQPQDIIIDALYEDSWTNSWRQALSEHDYIKVHTIRLVGIILSLFTKRKHLLSIRDIETSYTRIGLKGLWGNKGAVSLRFNYKGSSICLTNCHLTPHDNHLAYRVTNYHSITKSQKFAKEKIATILDHDLVFWFGDLNFRLDTKSNFTAKDIADLVSNGDLKPLLEHDELRQTISEKAAFNGFSEAAITFKPTYKFLVNTGDYDLKRRPGWTDRILYRTFDGSLLACRNYSSQPEVDISDHKPVFALFDLQLKGGAVETVQFDAIADFKSGETPTIVYRLPNSISPSSWHWIAFFRVGFSSYGEFMAYVWSSQQPVAGRPGVYEVTMSDNTLRIPGQYQAMYMSDVQPYHMLGISSVFEILEGRPVSSDQTEL